MPDAASLRTFVVDLLQAYSVFEYDAEVVADVVLGSRSGTAAANGLTKLPFWMELIQEGQIDPRGRPLVLAESPALLTLDGSGALGPVAAMQATQWAIEKAPQTGVAMAVVKNGRDLGPTEAYLSRISEAGLIGLLQTGGYREPDDTAYGHADLLLPAEDDDRTLATGLSIAGASQEPADAVSPFASPLPMLAMALANGRDPAHRHAAPNKHQAEHLVIVVDPRQGIGLDSVQRCIDRELPSPPSDAARGTPPDDLWPRLTALAADRDVHTPW